MARTSSPELSDLWNSRGCETPVEFPDPIIDPMVNGQAQMAFRSRFIREKLPLSFHDAIAWTDDTEYRILAQYKETQPNGDSTFLLDDVRSTILVDESGRAVRNEDGSS